MEKDQGGLEALLGEIESAAGEADRDATTLSVADMQAHFGRRAFGPILVIAALPVITPLVNIPGVASTMGIVIFLLALQMLLGRSSIWLPNWLRRRSVQVSRFKKAARYAQPFASRIDKLMRPRLEFLTHPPFVQGVAFCCAALGGVMPVLEAVPGTSAIPGVPVVLFGLGIMTHDGLLIVLGFIVLALISTGAGLLWTMLPG